MIQIKSQDGQHQYDEAGRAITDWHEKLCAWIVNSEFRNHKIDWWGSDNDFPAGMTMSEAVADNPNWNKMPNIAVTWYWNTKESCIKAFGEPSTFLKRDHDHYRDYWDIQHYPYTASRDWGNLEYNKEKAIEQLGKYCKFNVHAERTVVRYNEETIFDGALK